ncbi:MAG: EAL domain-containing protein [Methylomonas lenta]|nr:EAL domain-containing protein [Methylomonas lenta]
MEIDQEIFEKVCDTLDEAVEYIELTLAEQAKILQFQQNVLKLVALGSDCDQVCEKLCLLEEQLLPNSIASVMLLDEAEQQLNVYVAPSIPQEAIIQLNGLQPGPTAGSCGNALYCQAPVFVGNTFTDSRWDDIRQIAIDFNICACWSMPIRGKGGRVIGSFALSSFEHRMPGSFHRKLLEIGSFIIGIVLEQRHINQQLHLAGKVFEHSTEGIMITDSHNIIVSVNRAFTRITGYESDEVVGKNPSLLASTHHEADFYQNMWYSINSLGHWQGEVCNKTRDGKLFFQWLSITAIMDTHNRVTHYLAIFLDITEKKQAEEVIWRQANFDMLTGLSNRNRFYDRLEQDLKIAAHNGQRLALMSIDLDRFKEINDSFGHATGDALLKAAGNRLLSNTRATDLLAHLSGDEFMLILNNVTDSDDIEQLADQILEKISVPFDLEGKLAYVSASIGITLYPDDAQNIETLLQYVEQAMYAAKAEGRNRWRYFTPAMQKAAEMRSRTVADLRSALVLGQFYLHYQPIVELESGKVHKAEALIRWQHPVHGIISPAEFIPIAEESHLIIDIGNWVFQQASRQVACWQTAYGSDFQISINQSPVQFHGESSAHWASDLNHMGLDGHSIVVEITEGLLLDASEPVSRQLLAYRDAGIQVAIDDFGTGYSSLSYLKKFDIDYLKIDQSFVRNLTPGSSDRVLCEAIITMAHRLGMKVIAEGVETQQQLDILKLADCDYAQGYLFSRPLSADVFAGFMLE